MNEEGKGRGREVEKGGRNKGGREGERGKKGVGGKGRGGREGREETWGKDSLV